LFLALFGGQAGGLQGEAFLCGKPYIAATPRDAINQGVALVTNDRKATGLVLPLSIIANTTLADLPRLSPGGWRSPGREQAVTSTLGHTLSLRTSSLELEVGALSGGNQQKVVLAKWLQVKPQLLLLDEPTRGIDVGAKREIYQILHSLAEEGIAIMLITSELPELIGLSDRILVMHRGRITAEFDRASASPAKILEAAMGKTTGKQE
jgi:ABC-type sugar transport system ATPase subunit